MDPYHSHHVTDVVAIVTDFSFTGTVALQM